MTKKVKTKSPTSAGKKQDIKRNPDGTFPKGVSGNPEGKNAGTQHFKTIFIKAMEKIAKDTGEKAEDQEMKIVARGILEARKGNFPFYKDVLDRVYGKAPQTIDLNATVKRDELTEQEIEMLNKLVGEE